MDPLNGILVFNPNNVAITGQPALRNIWLQTSVPGTAGGQNGDLWLVYTP